MGNVTGDSLAISGAASIGGSATIQGNTTINRNLKVRGWLDAVNVRDIYKGIFSSSEELAAAYPNPKDGWIAGVGSAIPYTAYIGENGAWVNTESTYTPEGTSIDTQAIWAAIGLRALISEMSITNGTGANADKVTIQLKSGLTATVLKSHQSLSGLALKNEMSVTPVTGQSDKKDVQLKSGTTVRVLTEHQDISGKADANSVFTKAQVVEKLGLAVGESIRCTFNIESDGEYTLCEETNLLLMVIDGVGYENSTIELEAGTVTASFVFIDPSVIPDGAFSEMDILTNIHIPSYVHTIGTDTFKDCAGLVEIECEAMTPPKLGENAFGNITVSGIKLNIHKVVAGAYRDDPDWGDFDLYDMNNNPITIS